MEKISSGKADLTFRVPEQGKNELSKLAGHCNGVIKSLNNLISELQGETGILNEIMSEAVVLQQPPSDKGRRLKIYYATQVTTRPPTFVVFCNSIKVFHFSYQRYIENQLRRDLVYDFIKNYCNDTTRRIK